MFTELHWIDGPWAGRLAITARPRGGDWLEDEIKSWRRNGVGMVLSLLTPGEIEDLDLQHEPQFCHENGIRFLLFPIVDRSVPQSDGDTAQLLEQIDNSLAQGENVVVHCRQGIGRSGMIAASLLAGRGCRPEDAIERVSAARQASIPDTPQQRAWIINFRYAFK